MTGDVTVIGLKPGTCPLEDIAMDVPHSLCVTIPAEKAARSKDLWRCISQRLLFKLNGSGLEFKNAPSQVSREVEELREQVRILGAENRALREALVRAEQAQQTKLDAILAMLQQGGTPAIAPASVQAARAVPAAVVELDAPPYIPSKIHPDDAEAHVQLDRGSSEGDVTANANLLRSVRQRTGQQ